MRPLQLLPLLLLATVLAACDNGDSAKPRAVSEAGPPERIVSLAPSVTEMLYAIGAGPRVVGTDDFSNYPPEAAGTRRVGGIQVNYEAVTALEPDLVVGVTDLQGPALAHLDRLGLRTLALDTTGYDRTVDAIRRLGSVVGNAAGAETVASELESTRDQLQTKAGTNKRPRVLFVAEASTRFVAGRGTFLDELIRLAGGENAVELQGFAALSREALAGGSAPDVILVTSDEDAALARAWKIGGIRPRIVVAPRDILVRPGPRLGNGLLWLADALQDGKAGKP